MWPAVVVVIIAVAAVAGALWLACQLRWQALVDRLGSFPCILIDHSGQDKDRWGAAVIGPEALRWYAKGSLVPRPAHEWRRRGLEVVANVDAQRDTGYWETIRLRSNDGDCLLILSPGASAGLISWVEAGPTRQEPTPCG